MIIKKYVANDLEQATKRMREELGPEATILNERPVQTPGLFGWFGSKKVEITVAVEPEHLKAHKSKGKTATTTTTATAPQQTKNALQSNLEELKQMMPAEDTGTYTDPRLRRTNRPQTKMTMDETPQEQDTDQRMPEALDRAAQGLIERFREASVASTTERNEMKPTTKPVAKPKPKTTTAAANTNTMTSRNTAANQNTNTNTMTTEEQLRKVIREEMSRAQNSTSVGTMDNNDEETVGSVRFLMSKGVARSIAMEIDTTLTNKLGRVDLTTSSPKRSEWLNAMHRELTRRIKTADPIEMSRGRTTCVALVGSTGVGKTTTLAKLAATYANELGRKVAVISLDTVKLGAREQIGIVTQKMGIPLQVVSTTEQLTRALREFNDRDLVLIDTAGCNQYHKDEIQELADMLAVVPGVRVLLTVSAATKDLDVIATIKNFAPMSIDSLVMTKLDETIAHGLMVNVCEKTGLPISYLTDGQRVSGHMRVADATVISKEILLEHNSAEERSLRELVGA